MNFLATRMQLASRRDARAVVWEVKQCCRGCSALCRARGHQVYRTPSPLHPCGRWSGRLSVTV